MRINTKILLFIIPVSIAIFGAAIGYVSLKSRNTAMNNAKTITDTYARESANLVKSNLDADLFICRTIAQSFLGYKNIPREQRYEIYLEMQKNILDANPEFLGVGTSWELSAIDSTWTKTHGRELSGYYRDEGELKPFKKLQDMEGDSLESLYYQLKVTGMELIDDPKFYSYTDREEDKVINTNISIPILDQSNFVGVAGIDVDLARFQNIIDEIKPFENSHAFLVSNNGSYVAHPKKELVGKNVVAQNLEDDRKYNFAGKIKNGENFSFETVQPSTGEKIYVSFAAVTIDGLSTPWSIGIVVPLGAIMEEADWNFWISITVGVIGILLLAFSIWYFVHNLTKPLILSNDVLHNLADGKIHDSEKLHVKGNNEIAEIALSINKLIDGLNYTAYFAEQIGKGNLDAEFNIVGEEDMLSSSLLNMRESLKQAQDEEEKRKREDEKYNWANKGITKFADILRMNYQDMKEFSYSVISNLVEYVGANQGGLFFVNDEAPEDIFIELKAAYAYSKRKFHSKRIELGVGLIGRCVKEKKLIYMTDIPDGYINITSGLGESTPKSLIVVPLKFGNEVYGVIEMASFKPFEIYIIDFIEKLSESIASTISTVKINVRTAELLKESKKQSEELAIKEEEMRQNMEEMRAAQEEADRKQKEMDVHLRAINSALGTLEFDLRGVIIDANELFLSFVGYSLRELRGKHHSVLFESEFIQSKKYEEFWSEIKAGRQISGDYIHIAKNKRRVYLSTGYTPSYNEHGELYKVVQYANNVTQTMDKFSGYETQIKLVQDTVPMIEYDTFGNITEVNHLFIELSGYMKQELIGRPQSMLVEPKYLQSGDYNRLWQKLLSGEKVAQKFKIINKHGKEVRMHSSFAPLVDLNGNTYKVVQIVA